jgi:two-component system, OmpR family, response regulator
MGDPQVILVEDDTNVAKLVQLGLKRENIAVRHASTIAEGRQFLQGGEWDILLLDRRLPDGDGVDLCAEVRGQNPHGYILMLTGDATSEAKLAGFGCGADDYVTKPFHLDELIARVRAGKRIVELQKQLLNLTKTDGLTDIRNRRSFDEALDKRFAHARR